MIVSELMEELKRYSGNLKVIMKNGFDGDFSDSCDIEEITIEHLEEVDEEYTVKEKISKDCLVFWGGL